MGLLSRFCLCVCSRVQECCAKKSETSRKEGERCSRQPEWTTERNQWNWDEKHYCASRRETGERLPVRRRERGTRDSGHSSGSPNVAAAPSAGVTLAGPRGEGKRRERREKRSNAASGCCTTNSRQRFRLLLVPGANGCQPRATSTLAVAFERKESTKKGRGDTFGKGALTLCADQDTCRSSREM